MSGSAKASMTQESIARAMGTLRSIFKSVNEADLDDLMPIESVSDKGNRDGVPSAGELGMGGAGQAMHGAAASPAVEAHGAKAPQESITADYQQLAGMLGGFGKALKQTQDTVNTLTKTVNTQSGFLKSLTAALAKSEEEAKEEEKDEMEKAVRKARFSVRKAEDADEDEMEGCMEKATAALKAAADAVSKAEDEAEDDKDEEKVEKSRTELRTLKGKLKALVSKAAPASAAPAAQAQDVAALTKAVEGLLAQSKSSMSVPEVLALLSHGTVAAKAADATKEAPGVPPTFAKASVLSANDMLHRVYEAEERGELRGFEISKAKALVTRLELCKAGRHDFQSLNDEVQKSSDSIKAIFAV